MILLAVYEKYEAGIFLYLAPIFLLNTIIIYAIIKHVRKIYEKTAGIFTSVVMIGYSILSIAYLYFAATCGGKGCYFISLSYIYPGGLILEKMTQKGIFVDGNQNTVTNFILIMIINICIIAPIIYTIGKLIEPQKNSKQ